MQVRRYETQAQIEINSGKFSKSYHVALEGVGFFRSDFGADLSAKDYPLNLIDFGVIDLGREVFHKVFLKIETIGSVKIAMLRSSSLKNAEATLGLGSSACFSLISEACYIKVKVNSQGLEQSLLLLATFTARATYWKLYSFRF